jgi:predicted nucleic acid-binding protein
MYSPLTFSIFENLEKGDFNGVTSVLTLLEILVKPKRESNSVLTERYKILFETFPNLQVKTLNENIADIASGLRANYNINTPDAIQVATSLEAHADVFITNDTSLKKITEIKVLLLSELLK